MAVENPITKTVPEYSGEYPNKIVQGNSTAFFAALDVFNAFVAALPGHVNELSPQMNTLATEISGLAESVAQFKADAEESASIAQAVVLSLNNYQGAWGTLTGPLDEHVALKHDGIVWMTDTYIEDVTLSEPAVGNDDYLNLTALLANEENPTLTAALNCLGNDVINPNIVAETEEFEDLGTASTQSTAGTVVLDAESKSNYAFEVDQATIITMSNLPAAGILKSGTSRIDRPGLYGITWPTGSVFDEATITALGELSTTGSAWFAWWTVDGATPEIHWKFAGQDFGAAS